MFKKSITLKLTLGFLIIVMISTLIVGTISLSIFKNNVFEVKRNNMLNHAHEVSALLAPLLEKTHSTSDSKDIPSVLNTFTNTKTWIADRNSRILAFTKDGSNYIDSTEVKKQYDSIIMNGLKGTQGSNELLNPYYNEEMMTISVPIRDNINNVIGVLILHSSIADLSKSMDDFFIYLIYALIGEIILAGLMGYYFSKKISDPIKKINNSAVEMAKGNFGIQTNIYLEDEVGQLSSSFDLLSLKLKHTIGQLSEEKTKLSSMITSMSDGIMALDINLEIININNAAIKLLSSDTSNFRKEINEILNDLDLRDLVKNSMIHNQNESINRKINGKTLNFTLSPISVDSNKIIGIVVLIQDISEKEALEQMRKDFVSNVSHEFRTPLTIMKGNLESIIDGMIPPEETPETCVTLLKETNRLERMVRDLLILSKLDSGKLETNFGEIEMNLLMQDISRTVKPLTRNKDIRLNLSCDKNLPPLYSDYDKLKQLLLIFLDNAIKFSPIDSEIEIKSTLGNGCFILSIKDNGIGIDPANIKRLGERFYKEDRARNSSNTGTGLGISIAHKLIELLKGDLSIESELNKGTTIKIILPIKEENYET